MRIGRCVEKTLQSDSCGQTLCFFERQIRKLDGLRRDALDAIGAVDQIALLDDELLVGFAQKDLKTAVAFVQKTREFERQRRRDGLDRRRRRWRRLPGLDREQIW